MQGWNDFLVLGLVAVGSFGSGALLDAFGWNAVQYAMAPALLAALVGVAWLWVANGRNARRTVTSPEQQRGA